MEGMLWFDDDKTPDLAQKLRRAFEHYRQKYGREPRLCLVNESAVDGEMEVDGVRVVPRKNVMAHHMLITAEADGV